MRYRTKATARVFSLILAVILMLTAFPALAFASIDAPLNGVTGNGWDDFGGLFGCDDTEVIGGDNIDNSTSSYREYDNEYVDTEKLPTEDNSTPTDISLGTSRENSDVLNVATPGTTQGTSEDNPMAWFEEYLAWAMEQIGTQGLLRASGSPTFMLYKWGNSQESDRVYFSNGGYINSSLPRVTIGGKQAFCIVWNGQNPVGNYTSSTYNPDPRIAQIIANYEKSGKSGHDYAAAQIAIWAVVQGTSVSSWGTCSTSSSISAITNGSVDYSGYQFEKWSGGAQDLITWDTDFDPNKFELTIIKKNEDGSKVVSNATFNVTGPNGFNYTGKTNTQGKIVIPLETLGTYTVTETEPPAGYAPADPASQTVTLSEANRTAEVVFNNKWDVPDTDEPDGEGGNYHIEVETNVFTETEVYNQKSYSYSDAIGVRPDRA